MTALTTLALVAWATCMVIGARWVLASLRLHLRARRVERWRRAWDFVQRSHVKVLR